MIKNEKSFSAKINEQKVEELQFSRNENCPLSIGEWVDFITQMRHEAQNHFITWISLIKNERTNNFATLIACIGILFASQNILAIFYPGIPVLILNSFTLAFFIGIIIHFMRPFPKNIKIKEMADITDEFENNSKDVMLKIFYNRYKDANEIRNEWMDIYIDYCKKQNLYFDISPKKKLK